MSSESTNFNSLLSEFDNESLALLTPAERAEFDRILADMPKPTVTCRMWMMVVPTSIRVKLLELMRGDLTEQDASSSPAARMSDDELWSVITDGMGEQELTAVPQVELILPSLNAGRWLGDLPDPAPEDDKSWLRWTKLQPGDKLWERQQKLIDEERNKPEASRVPSPVSPTITNEPAQADIADHPAHGAGHLHEFQEKPMPEATRATIAAYRRSQEPIAGVPEHLWTKIKLGARS